MKGRKYGLGVPKFRTPTTIRLEGELKQLEELRSQSTILRFQAVGDPADQYEFEFHGKCLVPGRDGGSPVLGDFQKFSLKLGSNFPRTAPQAHWQTPIVHPNISGGNVCMGNFASNWTPNFHLTDLVEVLWDMARLAVFNVHSAYDRDQRWAKLDEKYHFPVDRRPLRDLVLPNNVGSSIVRPEGEEDDILIIGDDEGICDR